MMRRARGALLSVAFSAALGTSGIAFRASLPLTLTSCSGKHADGGADASNDAAVTCPPNVDLKHDSDNCGRCGHPCRGGTCDEGRCQAMEFAPGTSASSLLRAGDAIYWTNHTAGKVERQSVNADPSTRRAIATEQGGAFGLAVDDAFVYFTAEDAGIVARCPLDGCASPPAPIATAQGRPEDLVLAGTSVFWGNVAGGAIMSAPKAGGAPPTQIAQGASPRFLVADAKNLYWLDGCNVVSHPESAGGSNVIVASNLCGGSGLALDGDTLYVSAGTTNVVAQVSISGGAPLVLQGITDVPAGITFDDSFVFWIDRSADGAPTFNGGLERLLKTAFTSPSGSSSHAIPERLAEGGRGTRVVVDEDYVYWTSLADPNVAIERVAK